MKVQLALLFLAASHCFGQLPFQVKPKERGFPGKHFGVKGKGTIQPLYRLNNTFIPSHYDVEVRVILDNDGPGGPGAQFTAPGKVTIVGVKQEKSSTIALHSNNIDINNDTISVQRTSGGDIAVNGYSVDEERDFLILQLASEVDVGEELQIHMEYVAKIIDSSAGLFTRTYETETGEIRRMAATQFESVDARRMFPCFDEPDLKATFSMTVIRKSNYTTSLANTELIESVDDPEYADWKIDTFVKTVPMSTYLIAISVSDFGFSEALFGTENKPARTYAPKHMVSQGGPYTAMVQAKCLGFYEEYFNETYKLSKMDSITVNGYGGAMENWGLNVYGTPYILFFPGEQPESHRNLVTLIIAHELAHQWFGNLVTLKWWNEVYLNEGLTTYTQYLGMEAASPDLMGLEFAILDAVQYSMLFDAGPYTHPLSSDVTTPDEIDAMFSTISYEKGASVMRMVDGFLTRETLKKGLQAYLKKMSFQGAVQQDLFESLQEVAAANNRLPAGLTMPAIMHTWTDQTGFPVVSVKTTNATHVSLSQKRFKNADAEEVETYWYVPVTVATADNPDLGNLIPQVWLPNDATAVDIEHDSSKWLMINQNASGFYRVLYDDSRLQLIQAQLERDASRIPPLSRSQLIDDYFVFVDEEYVSIAAALNLTRYLIQETHFTVWSTFFDHFADIYTKFSAHTGYVNLQAYLRPKVDAALAAVGVEETADHSGAKAILRADLLDWACSMESSLCSDYAKKLLGLWKPTPADNPIKSVDARATLECAIVASGGQEAFDFMFERYKEADNGEIRVELLSALACAKENAIVEELLNKTLSSTSGLLPTDASLTLERVAANPASREIIMKFISANIEYIVTTIGEGNARPIGSVLTALATTTTTEAQRVQIEGFLEANQEMLTSIAAIIRTVRGLMNINIAWMDTTGFDIWMWLWLQ